MNGGCEVDAEEAEGRTPFRLSFACDHMPTQRDRAPLIDHSPVLRVTVRPPHLVNVNLTTRFCAKVQRCGVNHHST